MIKEGDEILAVICGGSKCGKTTLAIALIALLWRRHRLRSIVFDPFMRKTKWGPSAWVTDNLTLFKHIVNRTHGCAVVWDESSTSISKASMEDRAFFTNIRHNHKAFFVIVHDFTVISPLMRTNLSEAFIFRQSEERAHDWRRLFTDSELVKAAALDRRQFIHKRAFETPVIAQPSLEQYAKLSFNIGYVPFSPSSECTNFSHKNNPSI
jgi:hypothetical protein